LGISPREELVVLFSDKNLEKEKEEWQELVDSSSLRLLSDMKVWQELVGNSSAPAL
jgi:hypothetical protein